MKLKKTLFLIMALALALGMFSACQSAPAAAPAPASAPAPAESAASSDTPDSSVEKLKVGVGSFNFGVTWQIQAISSLEQHIADYYPDQIDLQVFNADGNVADQVTQIENMINDEYDIIIVDAVTPTGINGALKKAYDAGIIVIVWDAPVDNPNNEEFYHLQFTPDHEQWGRLLAQGIVDALDGTGKVVVLNGPAGNAMSLDRIKGAAEVFSKYPNIEILAEVDADFQQAPAEEAMTSWINAFPEIDAVLSQGGAMTMGALNVIQNNGMDPIPMSGEDLNGFLRIWDELKDKGFNSCATGVSTRSIILAFEGAMRIHEGVEIPKKDYTLDLKLITTDTLPDYFKPDMPDDYWCMSTVMCEDRDVIWPNYYE